MLRPAFWALLLRNETMLSLGVLAERTLMGNACSFGGCMQRRVAYFDNVKAVLIALVVFGHFALPIHNDYKIVGYVYDLIYLFHMPLFVFITGLFGKSVFRDGRFRWQRVVSYLLLGVLFNLTLLVIEGKTDIQSIRSGLLMFGSAPWYLIALSWWYLLTPIMSQVKSSVGIGLCIVLSLVSGAFPQMGDFLAISRTAVFLPFYFAGYYCTLGRCLSFKMDANIGSRLVLLLAAVIVVSYPLLSELYQPLVALSYGNSPYADAQVISGMALRLLQFGVAAVLSFGVLRLVPDSDCKFTVLGQRTLQIYVWHRIVRGVCSRVDLFEMMKQCNELGCLCVLVAVSGIVAVACAIPLLGIPIKLVSECKWQFLESKNNSSNAYRHRS